MLALLRWQDESVGDSITSEEYAEAVRVTKCDSSVPLNPANWAKFPHNKHGLKMHVRSGVSPEVRKELWLDLLGVIEDDLVLFAKAYREPSQDDIPEQVKDTFGWPYDTSTIPSLCNKPGFKAGYDRVLQALALDHHHVTVSPIVPVLVQLALHFVDEWECFALVSKLLRKTGWLDRNHRESRASTATLKWICATKLDLRELSAIKPVTMTLDGLLGRMLEDWCVWPFCGQPFWIAVRVMDMFLVEGPKFLYKLAFSAMRLFVATHKETILDDITKGTMLKFIKEMPVVQKSEWFRAAFSKKLPKNTLLKRWGLELNNMEQSRDDPQVEAYVQKVTPDTTSEILSTDAMWNTLWEWLPLWVTSEHPECLFRASRDGYNLRTLYRYCEHVQPIILVVRTTNDEVFGAFISSELVGRHGARFFGNGESFIFSLKPVNDCYRWSRETDLILRGTDHELAVGSGGGAYGLFLDGDLDRGSTATCTAFLNPPLTGGAHDFKCAAIEVYACT
ncbi:hypothetical protein EMCRGX_G016216 [Ephydatia muelleri]